MLETWGQVTDCDVHPQWRPLALAFIFSVIPPAPKIPLNQCYKNKHFVCFRNVPQPYHCVGGGSLSHHCYGETAHSFCQRLGCSLPHSNPHLCVFRPWQWGQFTSALDHWKGLVRTSALCSVARSCLTLCGPEDCSPPGSSDRGISQARVLERVAVSSSRGSSRPRDQISGIAGKFSTNWAIWEALFPQDGLEEENEPWCGSRDSRWLLTGGLARWNVLPRVRPWPCPGVRCVRLRSPVETAQPGGPRRWLGRMGRPLSFTLLCVSQPPSHLPSRAH